MKHRTKRALSLLLTLAMLCSLLCVTSFAADNMEESTEPTVVTIGDGTASLVYTPYANYYYYSLNEMIYTKDKIGKTGDITKIAFYVGSASSCPTDSVKIYMGHTTKDTFTSRTDWISPDDLTLVYEGAPTLGLATGWETITLDKAFAYSGEDNLVIAVASKITEPTVGLTYSYTSVTDSCLCRYSQVYEKYANYDNLTANSNKVTDIAPTGIWSKLPNLQLTMTASSEEDDPVVDSPYTATITRNGTGVVHAGDTVTMDVAVSGADFRTMAATVTYDKDVFTLTGYEAKTGEMVEPKNDSENGAFTFSIQNDADMKDGSVVATLSFTANSVDATAAGAFGFSYATAAALEDLSNDAVDSATEGTSVTVTKQYTVTFLDKDGGQIASYTVDDGEKLAAVPDAPAVTLSTFNGWKDSSDATLTADAILAAAVTGDATYQATYTAASFSVTVADGLSGNTTATYGVDYRGAVADFNSTNYVYTVTYAVPGSDAVPVELDEDGSFTVSGDAITGALTLTVEKTLNIEVAVYEDYVTGYSLVTVSGGADNYSYDGNVMFCIDAETGLYAYVVEGTVTEADAFAEVAISAADQVLLTIVKNDVNGTGTVDNSDTSLAYNCYQVASDYTVAANMEVYIRADVNGDHVVNMEDVSAVATQAQA